MIFFGGSMSTSTEIEIQKKPIKRIVLSVVFGIVFVLSVALISISVWYKNNYFMEFAALLEVLNGPIEGTGANMIHDICWAVIPSSVIALVVYVAAIIVIEVLAKKHSINFNVRIDNGDPHTVSITRDTHKKYQLIRIGGSILCSCTLVFSLIFTVFSFKMLSFLQTIGDKTTIYEDRYVDPADVAITANGETKNIIYIYLESMETTHASVEAGGMLDKNYIPNLTKLAIENTNFSQHSDTSKLGGFYALAGSSWTIAGILSSTGGIPYAFKVGNNGMDKANSFAPLLTTFGDILEEKGYHNYFLCGSDAVFGGRESYFSTHGNYTIYDLYTARADGSIPANYHDGWWGYEDHYLYEIAKAKITEAASKDEPFNFTMLTVDTHPKKGHGCKLCGGEDVTENVLPCADTQIYNFVNWCKEQSFYEDTVIVIVGDHLRSDNSLVEDFEYHNRRVYNCIINSDAVPVEGADTSRLWCTFDLFPTVLAAMNFNIDGNRLGLGVNMYSGEKTLIEEMGFDEFDYEMHCSSDFYTKRWIFNIDEKKNEG